MSVLKFDVYRTNEEENRSELATSVEINTETDGAVVVQKRLGAILDLDKNKAALVAPLNAESAWILMKPKRRGRSVEVAPEVVEFVHVQYVENEYSFSKILLETYKKFEVELSENVLKAIVNQERDTDVPGIDHLRERAEAMKGTRGTRNKYTAEQKEEWVRLHVEEEMSGSEIARKLNINNTTVNAHLSKTGVQQNGRGRAKTVEAEQVE